MNNQITGYVLAICATLGVYSNLIMPMTTGKISSESVVYFISNESLHLTKHAIYYV